MNTLPAFMEVTGGGGKTISKIRKIATTENTMKEQKEQQVQRPHYGGSMTRIRD